MSGGVNAARWCRGSSTYLGLDETWDRFPPESVFLPTTQFSQEVLIHKLIESWSCELRCGRSERAMLLNRGGNCDQGEAPETGRQKIFVVFLLKVRQIFRHLGEQKPVE
ncbi:hypothetical protein KIN20_018123 [Parelaphostrongylus tenuis]|uniref:Uncharacterized protein n=1 Tax=Parelaphostrongylus tenuis TaxID=148309 RepID=A0AAD5N0Q5_PARTN|nr:hypothetical protein KIN20_018123 [Parelaphostrongylus tenuis]